MDDRKQATLHKWLVDRPRQRSGLTAFEIVELSGIYTGPDRHNQCLTEKPEMVPLEPEQE